MLLPSSPQRLALLAAIFFIVVILSLQQTSYDFYLPSVHFPTFSSSHNSKGRPGHNEGGPHELDVEAPGFQVGNSAGEPANTDVTVVYSSYPIHPSATPLPHESYEQIQSKIDQLHSKWTPPNVADHWPPYDWYSRVPYDPNLWEGFEWDNDFYIHNGVNRLAKENPSAAKAVPYLPYPNYNTPHWRNEWRGEHVSCKGARGKLLNESREDWMMAYPTLPNGFPQPSVGDAGVIGIDVGHCFDRYHRFGPYGLARNIKRRVYDYTPPTVKPDWSSIQWGDLQNECLVSNSDRYRPSGRQRTVLQPSTELSDGASKLLSDNESDLISPHYHHRTALLIRTWEDYRYTENDLEAIRAKITELSLLSGGEYQVFLFINIKDANANLNDPVVHQDLLDRFVPRELHSISILWTERILEQWYPKVGDWQVYWHQYMPLQWFSKMNPQFDFIWNWEMDARYTGSHYHLMEQIASFAKGVPRKYLWERNQRFYFPTAHGSYEQFLADTDAAVEDAVKIGRMEVVWGAQPYNTTLQNATGPTPPHSLQADDFKWGVGEEADLITLQPIWDPTYTGWVYRDKIFNFLPGVRPEFTWEDPLDEKFTHPDFVNIPRRTYINTVSRFSKRLLHAMHVENREGRTMQAEMWPATVALQHGLKAVYAPHPIWTDRKWPGWYMDAVFNADGNEPARWGARGDSVYNQDREHNFAGWSWYYTTDFPKTLYHRWLGWGVKIGSAAQYPNNPLRALGGLDFEEEGVQIDFSQLAPDVTMPEPPDGEFLGRKKEVVGGHGRMCLPPMLLHPVKRVVE